jgi:hypothetical protein
LELVSQFFGSIGVRINFESLFVGSECLLGAFPVGQDQTFPVPSLIELSIELQGFFIGGIGEG